MTALDLDRLLTSLEAKWFMFDGPAQAKARAALTEAFEALAAESEARRLVLVLKATELRQAEAEVERLKSERDEARATLEKENELIQFERMFAEEERKKAYRSSQPEMAEYLLTCEHEWRKTADKLSDRCDERDRALARAERAEEALRAVIAEVRVQAAAEVTDCDALRMTANESESPLPAPQPAPEVKL